MNYRLENGTSSPVLRGAEGELVFVRVRVDSRSLEDLLEALAGLEFPINPEIRHGHPETAVEFPAYDNHVAEIQAVIRNSRIEGVSVELASMLRAIA
jgi:hypothetical protein